jgi:AcrR family transcriptional regulator
MGRAVLGQVVSIEGEHTGRRQPDSLGRLKQAARKLFVERGYDSTRPQDVAREAKLGHGTFYLHFSDKRACFLSFVADARQELDEQLQARLLPAASLEQRIAAILNAIFDYSDSNPGLLRAAMTDGRIIDAEEVEATPLLTLWGIDWAEMLRASKDGELEYDADLIGQAIAGALVQASRESHRLGRSRDELVKSLTRFLIRALRPD